MKDGIVSLVVFTVADMPPPFCSYDTGCYQAEA